MPGIPTEEFSKTGFHAVKDWLTGSPLLIVLLLALLSIGGAYLKTNRDMIKEQYPTLYAFILVALILLIIIGVWFAVE